MTWPQIYSAVRSSSEVPPPGQPGPSPTLLTPPTSLGDRLPPRPFLPTSVRTSPTQFCQGASLIGGCSVWGQFGSLERAYFGGPTRQEEFGKTGVCRDHGGGPSELRASIGAGGWTGRKPPWSSRGRSSVPAHLRLSPDMGAPGRAGDLLPGAWSAGPTPSAAGRSGPPPLCSAHRLHSEAPLLKRGRSRLLGASGASWRPPGSRGSGDRSPPAVSRPGLRRPEQESAALPRGPGGRGRDGAPAGAALGAGCPGRYSGATTRSRQRR